MGEEAAVGAQLVAEAAGEGDPRAELQADREDGELGVCLPRQGCRSGRWPGRADPGEGGAHTTTGLTQGPPPGLAYICEGLKEQRKGLVTLVLWNNQLTHTGMAFLGMTLVSPPGGPRCHLPDPRASTVSRAPGRFWRFRLPQPLRPFPEGVALHRVRWSPAPWPAQSVCTRGTVG